MRKNKNYHQMHQKHQKHQYRRCRRQSSVLKIDTAKKIGSCSRADVIIRPKTVG